VVAFDNVPTGNAGNGKSTQGSSQNAAAAVAQSTAPKSARKAPGAAIVSGAWQQKTATAEKAAGKAAVIGPTAVNPTLTVTATLIITTTAVLLSDEKQSIRIFVTAFSLSLIIYEQHFQCAGRVSLSSV